MLLVREDGLGSAVLGRRQQGLVALVQPIRILGQAERSSAAALGQGRADSSQDVLRWTCERIVCS